MSNNIIKDTIDKIKKEHLAPKPKWQFVLTEVLYWIFFGVSVLLGGVAVSFIMFVSKFDLHPMIRQLKGIREWMIYIPFLWIVLLFLFVVASIYYWKKTEKGYKFNVSLVIIAVMILSLVLGITLYTTKLTSRMDKQIYNLPGFNQMAKEKGKYYIESQGENWLGGQVIEGLKDKRFYIEDFNSGRVEVSISNLPKDHLRHVIVGDRLKMMGERIDKEHFEADKVWPWDEKPDCERNFCPRRITE